MSVKQNKKLMFVIPSLEGGGAERVAANLLKEFNATDVSITLVLFSKKRGYGWPDNVKVRYINIEPHKNLIYTIFKFFLIIFSLTKIIKEEKPFNILSFMDYTNIIVILCNMLFHKKTKITISVRTAPTLHLHRYSKNFLNSVISLLIRLLYNRADKIIAVSEFSRLDLIGNFGIEQKKVVTIYNPADINRINILAEEEISHQWFKEKVPIIISVGRLSREKGFDYLLKAFAIVKEKMDVRLLILGEGEEEGDLKRLSRELGIDKDVYFHGFQENPYKYMKRSTIYVLSSLYEGFPNVLIEAMTCGVPVISTIYNPCTNEIIEHEKNGLLVPVADEKALAESMFRLLNDEELRRSMSEEAKKNIRKFSIERITDQYKAVLGI